MESNQKKRPNVGDQNVIKSLKNTKTKYKECILKKSVLRITSFRNTLCHVKKLLKNVKI